MEKVYLAGGFRSGWQKKVKEEVNKTPEGKGIIDALERGYSQCLFLDPFEKERGEFTEKKEWTSKEYTEMDLHMIRQSSIVFAYLEKGNPGLGVIAEIGYAIGLGKTVILVCEKSEVYKDRYLDFTRNLASITFNNLADGVVYLKSCK